MRPLVLSKAIERCLVTLSQVGTRFIAVCLSLPSHSWFPSYGVRLSLCVCVSDHVHIPPSPNLTPMSFTCPSLNSVPKETILRKNNTGGALAPLPQVMLKVWKIPVFGTTPHSETCTLLPELMFVRPTQFLQYIFILIINWQVAVM
jgi:hypothetical protein